MSLLELASDAVWPALRARRIGTPVSVRIVAHITSDRGQIEGLLACALETASRWLGGQLRQLAGVAAGGIRESDTPPSPRRLAALGSIESGQISVLAEFRKGQTALVTVGASVFSSGLLELVIVGTCGILSWESGPEVGAEAHEPDKPLTRAAGRIIDAVRGSLVSKQPVTLDVDGTCHVPTTGDAAQPGEPVKTEAQRPAVVEEQSPQPPLVRSEPPYGVLLIAGAHTHQENYASALVADRRCQLVGVTDERDVPERRRMLNEKLARSLGIPLLPELDQALARDDVQIVSVCAEPERRAGVIIRCAEAGKHLYLDKPLAASAAEADAVVAAVRKAGVVSQMFSQVRTPAAARLRRLVDSGSLGDVTAVHLSLSFAKGPAGTVQIDKPRAESERPGRFELVDSKRELYNVAVYPLVLMQWLLGRRVRRVWAVTANYFFAEHRRNDMEDFAVALLELDGGVTATLAVGRTGWRSHPMGGLNRTSIIGSKGAASIDAYRPRWEVWADELPWLPPRVDPQDPMGFWRSTLEKAQTAPKQAWLTPPDTGNSDVAYFLDCVEQGRPSDVSAELGANVVKTLMAAYRSAATGRFVVPQ